MIRPEARAALMRWREMLAGGALLVIGARWVSGAVGVMFYVGAAFAMVGMALMLAGWQRGRFRPGDGGPGAVDVDEGQVSYFGPLTGGAIALREVQELALIRRGQIPHWRLRGTEALLYIPVDASGAEALFDAFTALPGLRVETMLAALKEGGTHDTVIWRHADESGGPVRLH